MKFYVGTHNVHHARHLDQVCLSINRLWERKSDFQANEWIMDSGAFSEISQNGRYTRSVEEYAAQIRRWRFCGRLMAAVSQDWMCEPWILERTGLTVEQHQGLTIERYIQLLHSDTGGIYIMPVLQGYEPRDYVLHLQYYRDLIGFGAWVGVGSVCRRNRNPEEIARVLMAIKRLRPDLKLHGFGIKLTALRSALIQDLLYSADSMAWSYNARRNGGDANCWRQAKAFSERVLTTRNPTQMVML